MSRPDPGYSRGPYTSDTPASTLIGGGRGAGKPSGDLYDSLDSRASPAPYGSHEQGLNTVFEQDETASSPEMNRGGQQWGGYEQDQYGGGGGGAYHGQQGRQGQQGQQGQAYGAYDSPAQDYSQQHGYDQYPADSSQQAIDAPYYPGWVWDAASGQYLPDQNYGGEGEQGGTFAAEQAQAQDDSQAQQQSEVVDAPYYPGWVWDAASGQYLPDSSYGGEGEQQSESAAAEQGHAAVGGAQTGSAPGDSQRQYDSYGSPYAQASDSQGHGSAAWDQPSQTNSYSTQSQPSFPYDQTEDQRRQPAAFDAQEEDPYANDPYSIESHSQYGQGESYGQQPQSHAHDPYGREQPAAAHGQQAQAHEQDQEDPYAADSNPYADEAAASDPFAQSDAHDPFTRQQSYDPFGTHEQQQEASSQSYDAYAPQQAPPPSQPPRQQDQRQQRQQLHPSQLPPQQQPSSNRQEAFDPYAPKTTRAAPPPTAASQPTATPQGRAAYSPPPPQQQFTSFGAAFDASAQQTEPAQSAAYDPYSPPSRQGPPPQQQQQQQQARELPRRDSQQSEELPHDPYAPRKPQGKSQGRQPRDQRVYDPYNLQGSQSSQHPASPPLRHQPFPQAGSSASSAGLASPPLGRAALSPPPRSGSAASNASSRQASAPTQTGPPPRSGAQQAPQTAAPPPGKGPESVASPRSEASFNLASPPPRARQLPQQQQQPVEQRQAPPPAAPPAAPAFDLPPPRLNPSVRPPQRTAQQGDDEAPVSGRPSAAAPHPAAAPKKAATPASTSDPSRQSHATPSQPVLPSSQRKPPSTSGGLMRPPVPRAPHQRGASAFGSDSPYGALPSGPLTSAYEPPQTVDQIKEEEEEEEVQPEQKEPEKPEEFVPSWMQATSNAPPPPIFPNESRQQTVKQEQHDDSTFAPPPRQPPSKPPMRPQQQQPDLANDMNKMSLNDDRPSQQAPQHAPPPPASRVPPAKQSQIAPPPPRDAAGASPRAGGAPPPPGPAAARPPPSRQQQHQQQQQQQQRPLPQSQRPPQRGPAQSRPPPQMPMSPERSRVPQLHFEAPSPEVRADRRNERYEHGSGRITPVPTMSGIEETPEPREGEEDDYFGRSDRRQSDGRFGMDDSTVFTAGDEDRATGPTTPSSQYGGDWKADSQDAQGYDYLGQQPSHGQQQQQQQKPYDPYAPTSQRELYPPRDVPSRDLAVTPPAQQQGPTVYASPNKRAMPPRQAPSASAMARASSYDAPPSRKISTDSYGYDQQQDDAYAPHAPQQSQRQPYNPYASAVPQVQRSASVVNGEPADLGLERRRAPVVSFGFGGRMVVVFPEGGRTAYGADSSNPYGAPAANSQPSSPSTVHIRKLADVIPPSPDGTAFPGPIFLDGGKANAGKKRKEALSWLAQRIGELEQELSYARGAAPPGFDGSDANERRRKVESRLLLVKLVMVMVENEGKLTGSAKVDDAVRAIFTGESTSGDGDAATLPTADQLVASSSNKPSDASIAPFITYGVSPADLDQMTEYLLRGERREAVRHALDRRMWAHAFIIASCVDTDCWKEVTVEFLRTELTPSAQNPAPGAQGREALRVAYGMFAGLGAESMHQFIPPQTLSSGNPPHHNGAQVDNATASAPYSPANQQPLTPATLAKWLETVGMIVANRTAGDSAALTSLGDALAASGWIDAAHVCYLLSPQTSLAQGLGMPASRIVLVGSLPLADDATIDLESVKLTELVEFAFSLVPAVKGHDAFVGFPHLQAFRLYHAAVLADDGNVSQAHRYAEAVVNTLKLATKPSPFYHPRLVAQIKALSERLGAAPGQKEGGSWLARKVPRPTVNSLWSTFEGGFNKFVAGDEQPTAQQLAARAEVAKQANGAAVGAFSHFSSISPGSTSGTLSRAQSSHELNGSNFLHAHVQAQHASSRPTSPLATAPPVQPPHHQSPGPPPVKRAAFKTHHARSSSLGAFAGYEYSPNVAPPWQSYTPPSLPGRGAGNSDRSEVRDQEQSPASPRGPPSARRPQFAAVEEQLQEDESGFISPMAQFTPSVSPSVAAANQQQQSQQTHRRMTTAEELADLGIANSKSKKPAFDTLDEELEAEEGGVPQEKRSKPQEENSSGAATPAAAGGAPKTDDKPTIKPSKSWLGGWFKREASPANAGPGPVKANLGEQTSFVYDEKLKRWVNKSGKGGDESPATVTPPPRAATASPSKALRNGPSRFMSETPPVPPMPTRAATNPPPLSRSATSGDLRGDTRPPSAASNPTRPPSAAGMPPRTTGTPNDGAGGSTRSSAKRKPKYAVYAP